MSNKRRILVAVRISDGARYPGFRIDVTTASERKIEMLKESSMMGFDETQWRVEVVEE